MYLSHHLLAYFWKFRRDLQRFKFCMTATDDLPLGAGALAGVNFDTSRMFVAQELGFGGIAENSLDAVSNRDFVLDYLSAAATCATHLSQLGGEIVVWSSEEFGFCEVADRFASGSSLMPQKKNPDAAELLRAKAPRVAGRLLTLHGVLHGLPLTYNKDLQEDKEQLFDAIDTIELCLGGGRRDAGGHRLRPRAPGRRGVRRVARRHRRRRPAGQARRALPHGARHRRRAWCGRAVERGKPLSELTRGRAGRARAGARTRTFYELLRDGAWLESKVSEGGTALPARARPAGAGAPPARRGRRLSGAPLAPPATGFYDRPVLEVAARPGGLRACATARRRAGSSRPRPTTRPSPPATPTRG